MDVSPPEESISYTGLSHLTRLHFDKHFDYSPIAKASFDYQKANFYARHRTDTHYHLYAAETIPGFREDILLFNEDKGPLPAYAKAGVYHCMISIMMSWIQRIILVSKSMKVTYGFRKVIIR